VILDRLNATEAGSIAPMPGSCGFPFDGIVANQLCKSCVASSGLKSPAMQSEAFAGS